MGNAILANKASLSTAIMKLWKFIPSGTSLLYWEGGYRASFASWWISMLSLPTSSISRWSSVSHTAVERISNCIYSLVLVGCSCSRHKNQLSLFVTTFERVGFEINTKKMQGMTCTPSNIWLQLPTESNQRMCTGCTPAVDWDTLTVTCRECGKNMRVSSLGGNLVDLHEIYQQQVVAEELLRRREGVGMVQAWVAKLLLTA